MTKNYLDELILAFVKRYIKQLSDDEFLELTCDLKNLHDRLIEIIYGESSLRFRNPTRVTADILGRTKDLIRHFLKEIRKRGKVG